MTRERDVLLVKILVWSFVSTLPKDCMKYIKTVCIKQLCQVRIWKGPDRLYLTQLTQRNSRDEVHAVVLEEVWPGCWQEEESCCSKGGKAGAGVAKPSFEREVKQLCECVSLAY